MEPKLWLIGVDLGESNVCYFFVVPRGVDLLHQVQCQKSHVGVWTELFNEQTSKQTTFPKLYPDDLRKGKLTQELFDFFLEHSLYFLFLFAMLVHKSNVILAGANNRLVLIYQYFYNIPIVVALMHNNLLVVLVALWKQFYLDVLAECCILWFDFEEDGKKLLSLTVHALQIL